ncbi:MAG: HAD-IC family P-type ATPase, partial [Neisseriaceae bacterium]|nr:HAD-IC family P-type ATPase [Neisseriaceae bacterium]
IIQLKKQGHTVAMVGDGINDAAALTAADTGFALKGGTDIAQNAANATLMNGSANQVADAVIIAHRTLNTIRQNLFFAFIYNIIGIPLAAFGILSPAIAGAAMAASSISVLGNAVRLKRFRVK